MHKKIDILEAGRGLAALFVVAHHASLSADAFNTDKYHIWFDFGALGVDFFFVLSGFIIFHVHHNDPPGGKSALRFLSKRLRRIYIPYLPVTSVLIVLYFLLPHLSQNNREWSLFTSITLIATGRPPALSVAWTLMFEIMFYLFFLIFFFTRHFWLFIAAWAALTITLAFTGTFDAINYPVFFIFFHPLTLEFIGGMVASMLFRRIHPSNWAFPTIVGCILSAAYFSTPDIGRFMFGLTISPLVLGLALAETHFKFRIASSALLLGSASYSIYLVHNPLQSMVARMFHRSDIWFLTFAACCVMGLASGLFYHLLFEKPLLRKLTARNYFCFSKANKEKSAQ